MGLDMWFTDGKGNDIAYFRKHADLHGYLSELWAKKTGKNPYEFNCKKLRISRAILQKLKEFTYGMHDRHYHGFFWGESQPEDWAQTEVVLADIEHRLDNKERVYYTSWW